MARRDGKTRSYKRSEVAMSAVTLLAGLVMIDAIYTSVGPSRG